MKSAKELFMNDPEAMEEQEPEMHASLTSSYPFQLKKANALYKKDPATMLTTHPDLYRLLMSSNEFQLKMELKKAKEVRRSAMAAPVFRLLLPYLDQGLQKAWSRYITKKQELYRRQLVIAGSLCVTNARF